MSSTTSFAVPAPRSALLLRRRIATYFVGGVEEVPGLVGALAQDGRLVHELSVDIRDGVRESSMVCAVLLAGDEIEPLLDRLRALPSVVSSELA
jgi:hypothetical protein